MRKYIIIASLALAGFFTSCELERLPGDSIATDEAFETTADAELFRTGLYSLYRSANNNYYRTLSDHQVDVVNAVADYGNRMGLIYMWQDGLAGDYDIEAFYQTSYIAINNLNNFLENIDEIEVEDDAETATLQQYKGEAYLMRASLFHNLTRYFAKAYNPATADSDLGIALPLVYDPNARPSRSSLKDTYAQIQSDLNNAKTLLPDGGSATSGRMTKDFAHAIQARVSLETQEFDDAVNAADKIIPNYSLATSADELESLWRDDESSEIVLKLYTSDTEGRVAVSQFINFSIASQRYTPDYIPTKKVLDAYEDGDIRKEAYFTKKDIHVSGSKYEDVTLINKYPGNPDYDSNPNFSSYVNNPKLFMISEAYLIKAEAQARGTGLGDPIATLDILRSARGASLNGGDALELVKEERFKEMLAEGQRLLDLKRWDEGLNRTGGQTSMDGGLYTGGANGPFMTKPASDKMFVWEIPLNDLQTNPNMQPNW